MRVKTTIQFTPSAQVMEALASGDIGKACYKARVWINQQEQDTVTIPAGQPSITIETEQSTQEQSVVVGMLLSAFDKDGMQSQATPFEFTVSDKVPPARPTQLAITRVVPVLNVVEAAPMVQKAVAMPQSPAADEPQFYNVTVSGHPEILDGAVGVILGLDPIEQSSVHVQFGPDALNDVVPSNGPVTGKEFIFPLGTDMDIKVITPDQETITLQEYVNIQLAAIANLELAAS